MPTFLAVHVVREPRQLIVGAAMMLVTAIVQTFGVVTLEEVAERVRDDVTRNTTRARMLLVLSAVIVYLFGLHLIQMCLWAALYLPLAPYQSFAVALYESALAFTTMDVAELPPDWKFLSAAEGVTGLLMFAWSTGVLFNQTEWITEARRKYLRKHRLWGSKEGEAAPES